MRTSVRCCVNHAWMFLSMHKCGMQQKRTRTYWCQSITFLLDCCWKYDSLWLCMEAFSPTIVYLSSQAKIWGDNVLCSPDIHKTGKYPLRVCSLMLCKCNSNVNHECHAPFDTNKILSNQQWAAYLFLPNQLCGIDVNRNISCKAYSLILLESICCAVQSGGTGCETTSVWMWDNNILILVYFRFTWAVWETPKEN